MIARDADVIFSGGPCYTVDPDEPWVEAVAVRDGRVIARGAHTDIIRLRSDSTEMVDLTGRMLMPGLIDGHAHPTKGAVAQLFSCSFPFDVTPEQIAATLTRFIKRHPEQQVILGGRWDSGFFDQFSMPSPRLWLDNISAGRAVYLRDDSGHNGWANSATLALLGLTDDSADPDGGRLGRDSDGVLNGLLIEAADIAARARLPDWSEAQYAAGVREMVRIANGYGITGVTDADASEPLLKAYSDADRRGDLSLYVAASISTPYGPRDTPLDYAHLEDLRDRYATARVDTRFVKIYQDGVPTAARTAAMLSPYIDDSEYPPDFCGHLHVDEQTLTNDLAALEQRGFTVKMHTAGDRAVRVSLNAIEQAHRISGRRDLRHELAHAGLVAPADIPRFAALNVVADLSPYIWHPSPIMSSVRSALGERAQRYWPIRDLLEAGAPLLAGSDWPAAVASMDPWRGLEAMVTRADPSGETPGVLWGEQAITLTQAVKIFTLDGARALRRETATGSITVGKSADLIVLDQNIFELEPNRIARTQVEQTWFAGERVYQR